MPLKKGKKSTIETKFDQYGNKFSMLETVKEVDEKTVTKENNILLTREPTASLLSGSLEYLDEMETLLMIEAEVTPTQKIVKLKDDSVFLFKYAKIILHDKRIGKYTDKRK